MPKKVLLIIALLGAASLAPQANASLRCQDGLARVGDRMAEVRRLCGEPDVSVVLHSVITGQAGFVPYEEEWQYNFGTSQFMRFLHFQNGRLTLITTGPRGFNPQVSRRCTPNDLNTGMSQLELLARCGEPESTETRVTARQYQLGPGGIVYPAGIPAEEWLYPFGGQQFMRFVTLVNGRVVAVERSRLRD